MGWSEGELNLDYVPYSLDRGGPKPYIEGFGL